MVTEKLTIIIVGAGEVGKGLALRLTKLGHQVTIIDSDHDLIEDLDTQLDVMTVEGNGASAKVLLEAGIETAQLVIGVSDNDKANMLSCALAKKFGAQTTIARVRNEDYILPDRTHYADALNIDLIINPDEVAALELNDLLENPAATKVADFADGRLKLLGMTIPKDSPVCNHALSDLPDLGFGGSMLVATLARKGIPMIPRGDTTFLAGDRIYVIGSPTDLDRINQMGSVTDRELKRVVIVGASRASLYLAERLEANDVRIILIEQDPERCEQFASELKTTTVLNGDGTDSNMLNEAGVQDSSGFVACSQDDETNILAALLAKEQGAKRVITLVRKPQYIPLLGHIQAIDVALNPRMSTINAVMHFIRQRKNLSMATLAGEQAEAIEFEVAATSPLIGRKLKEGIIPREILLGAIVRGDDIIIPGGDDELMANDRAVVIALKENLSKVENLLSNAGGESSIKKFVHSITRSMLSE